MIGKFRIPLLTAAFVGIIAGIAMGLAQSDRRISYSHSVPTTIIGKAGWILANELGIDSRYLWVTDILSLTM